MVDLLFILVGIKDLTPLGIDRLMGFIGVYGGLVGFIVYFGGHKGSDPIGDRQVNGVYGGLWGFIIFLRGHKCSDPIGHG